MCFKRGDKLLPVTHSTEAFQSSSLDSNRGIGSIIGKRSPTILFLNTTEKLLQRRVVAHFH